MHPGTTEQNTAEPNMLFCITTKITCIPRSCTRHSAWARSLGGRASEHSHEAATWILANEPSHSLSSSDCWAEKLLWNFFSFSHLLIYFTFGYMNAFVTLANTNLYPKKNRCQVISLAWPNIYIYKHKFTFIKNKRKNNFKFLQHTCSWRHVQTGELECSALSHSK